MRTALTASRRRISGRAAGALGLAALAAGLAGCDRSAGLSPLAGNQGARAGAAAPVRGAPPVDVAGRWMLSSPGAGGCGMTLGGGGGATEGTIAPEGGCPGNFFTSRKWTFENSALVIRDHNGQPLGQLAMAAPGRFEGQATSGQALTLAR